MMATKKEHKYEVCNTFKDWLAKNGNRFNRKYKIRHYKKRGFLRIYFEDVTPEIHCHLNEPGGVAVSVHFRGKFWDYLVDLDCAIRRARNRKYYCGFCLEPKYYKTPQELLIEHSFETLLEWVNEKFTSSHVLELVGYPGFTAASIIDKKELPDASPSVPSNSDKMKMTAVIPVIIGKGFDGLSGMSEAPPAED